MVQPRMNAILSGMPTTIFEEMSRIARETDDRFVWTWSYDEHGRIREIARERRPPPPTAAPPAPPTPPPPAPPAEPDADPDAIVLDFGDGVDDGAGFDPDRRVQAFHYDGQGRLLQSLSLGRHEDDNSSATYYEYDCAPIKPSE